MAIIKNGTEGYGYNYASLSDIEKQGYKLPKMKVGVVDNNEYVFYFDEELKEWIQGSQIVVPESPKNKDGKVKMNKAQLYGSALTYARRYTTLMALQLSCDDDNEIENLDGEGNKKQKKVVVDDGEPASDKQLSVLKKQPKEVIANILNHYNIQSLEQISKAQATEVIGIMLQKSYGKEQSNN